METSQKLWTEEEALARRVELILLLEKELNGEGYDRIVCSQKTFRVITKAFQFRPIYSIDSNRLILVGTLSEAQVYLDTEMPANDDNIHFLSTENGRKYCFDISSK